MRPGFSAFLLAASFLLPTTGCHSAFIQTTITNQGPTIHTLEVDYPSQSFGTETLAANQTFHYRFKVQGSGPVKLQFQDAAGKAYTATGPSLNEGAEGTLTVTISQTDEVTWTPSLRSAR